MALGSHGTAEPQYLVLLLGMVLPARSALRKCSSSDPGTWLTPTQSFSLFLPSILKELGWQSVKAQGLTVPPNMVAFFLVVITAHFSDKLKVRGPFMIGGATVGIAGYIMLLASKKASVRYGGTFLVASGVYPCSPM